MTKKHLPSLLKKYTNILFDLDHTLWDFEKNSEEALRDLFNSYQMALYNKFTPEDFVYRFKEINGTLWDQYNRNLIDKDYIRNERFKMALTSLGLNESEVPEGIGEVYLKICPVKPHVIPYAFEILDYLHEKYRLHIISNGFDDVQDTKLTQSRLKEYFELVITSETAGFKKPSREMFEKAIELIDAPREECIMIGDNLETDIKGAINASLDIIYFNPDEIPHDLNVTYEISSLRDLKKIL